MFLGHERPVPSDARAVAYPRRVALRCREHVFVTVIDHLDRTLRLEREQCRMARDHVGIFLLAAEAATRRRLDDPYFVGLSRK